MRAYLVMLEDDLSVAVVICVRPAQGQAVKTAQHSSPYTDWTRSITRLKGLGSLVVRNYVRAVSEELDSISPVTLLWSVK